MKRRETARQWQLGRAKSLRKEWKVISKKTGGRCRRSDGTDGYIQYKHCLHATKYPQPSQLNVIRIATYCSHSIHTLIDKHICTFLLHFALKPQTEHSFTVLMGQTQRGLSALHYPHNKLSLWGLTRSKRRWVDAGWLWQGLNVITSVSHLHTFICSRSPFMGLLFITHSYRLCN